MFILDAVCSAGPSLPLFLFFYVHCPAACLYLALLQQQCVPFYAWFYALLNRGLSHDTDPGFFFFFSSLLSLFSLCSGKSVVSEPENEVQAAEVGGGGLGVSAEEERIASYKPVENGD